MADPDRDNQIDQTMSKKSWTERLEIYTAGAKADENARLVSVSREVFQRALAHEVWINPKTSGELHSYARVRSSTSDATYSVDLFVDEAKIFPMFPYVWKCNCKWGRERFGPCSHVIAVALERGRRYAEEFGTVERAREEGAQGNLGDAANDRDDHRSGVV